MRIWVFSKKMIIIFCFIVFLLFYIFFHSKNMFSLAVEIDEVSFLIPTLQEKFANIQKEDKKIAYLTFDDGPTTKATEKILDILKEEDVKASFFVVGKHVKEHPELVKRAYEEGHYIANHGYNHNNAKLYKNEDSFRDEVKNTDIEIGKAIGKEDYCSYIFRFPNGYMSGNYRDKKKKAAKILADMNYVYVDWNCLNRDSERKYSSYQLLNNLKKTAKGKGTLIILMHDTNDVNDTTAILKDSIEYLRGQGYSFSNFYDMINFEK